MKHWPTRPLGDFVAKKSGPVNPSKVPDEVFDLYSIPAFDLGEPEARAGREIGSAKQVVEEGDVLLSRIVPHIRRAWVVGENRGRRLIGSGEWIVFRSSQLHPRFLRYFLVGDPFHARFMQTVSGVGGSLLRAKATEVAKIELPVPPLEEQVRLVKLLDEADVLRKLRTQASRRMDRLIPALFHEMFGDPTTNTKGWPTGLLGNLATIEAVLVDPRKEEFQDLPHIGPDRIERNSGKLMPIKSAKEDGLISAKFLFDERDVLYSKIRPNLRKAALPESRGLCSADMYPVRPGLKLVREFLWAYLLTDHFTDRAVDLSARANMPKLNRAQLNSIGAPVPPLPLQNKFAQRVTEIRELEAEQAASRARLDALFHAMLDGAMEGTL